MNNYDTIGSSWFYSKDIATTFTVDNAYNNTFKPFHCKTELVGQTIAESAPNNNDEILKNVARSFKVPLINLKLELKLKWIKYCVLDW